MADRPEQSPFWPAAASSNSKRQAPRRHDAGFSLAETLVAMVVMVTGLLGIAQLMVVTIKAESMARNGALASRMGQGKLDGLMKANFDTTPQIQITNPLVDSLAADVPNYFDVPEAGIIRRWRVRQGPAGTRLVTVRVLTMRGIPARRTVDLTTLVRRW
jgi:hypothetical protein